jgi:hypothetical protein
LLGADRKENNFPYTVPYLEVFTDPLPVLIRSVTKSNYDKSVKRSIYGQMLLIGPYDCKSKQLTNVMQISIIHKYFKGGV